MASSITFVRVAVLGFTVTVLLQGCSSLGWGGYQGEPYQIVPPTDPLNSAPWGMNDSASYHIVQRGETLSSIAQRYGRDWHDVARWNNLSTPYTLDVGQRLLVSGTMVSPVYQPKPITSTPIYSTPVYSIPAPNRELQSSPAVGSGQYVVQPGDTVYRLSRRAGYSVSQLMSWNGLSSPQLLRIGQRFWLSPPTASVTQSAKAQNFQAQSVTTPISRPVTPRTNSSNYHVVVGGETLYSVARRYGYTPDEVAAWNGLAPPYTLTIGSSLRLGPSGAPTNSFKSASVSNYSVSSPAGSYYHIVSRGQTAYSIANRYGCTVNQLLANNGLNSARLSVGQKLGISNCSNPTSSNNSLATQSLASGGSTAVHIVKSGENLENIAKLYGVAMHQLAFWNGIGKPYTVYPGQRLMIQSY